MMVLCKGATDRNDDIMCGLSCMIDECCYVYLAGPKQELAFNIDSDLSARKSPPILLIEVCTFDLSNAKCPIE